MRFRLANADDYPAGLSLPWAKPLSQWPDEIFVDVARGLSRNLVRFVQYQSSVYAIKQIVEHVGVREYQLLRSLTELKLPVVEPVGLVTERPAERSESGGTERYALLVTRFLHHSLPFRTVISGGVSIEHARQLLDALAELLVELHLAGFFWGDVSLSNALFRRDAGRFSAYLVDAETGELHPQLSDGQRAHDLTIAEENVAGEFMDLRAGFGLPDGLDPIEAAATLVRHYEGLWAELTREEVFSAQEQYLIDRRIRRLNELGFDVEELDIRAIDAGHRIRMRAKVVEPGHHRRLLQTLTGLNVQENQARRLLNDLYRFRAWQSGLAGHAISEEVSAYRWLVEVYHRTLEMIPAELRKRLDDAEIFHQILEHRWYLSERSGCDTALADVVPSYVEQVLSRLPAAQLSRAAEP